MGPLLRNPSAGVRCTERSELYHLEPASRLTLGRMSSGEGRAIENGLLVEATPPMEASAGIKDSLTNFVSPSRSYSADQAIQYTPDLRGARLAALHRTWLHSDGTYSSEMSGFMFESLCPGRV